MAFKKTTIVEDYDLSNLIGSDIQIVNWLLGMEDSINTSNEGMKNFDYSNSEFFNKMYRVIDGLVDINDLEFSVRKLSSEDVRVEFPIVETDGPIINFMGLYIDLDSGYVVFGRHKREKFVPIISFYKYLERLGINVQKDVMINLIERYKVGDLDLDEFSESLKQNNVQYGDSNKSLMFNFLTTTVGESQKDATKGLTARDMMKFVAYVSRFMDKVYTKLSRGYSGDKDNNLRALGEISSQSHSEEIMSFLNPLMESKLPFRNLDRLLLDIDNRCESWEKGETINGKISASGVRSDEDIKEDVYQYFHTISSGVLSGISEDFDAGIQRIYYDKVYDVYKTSAMLLNYYDILDSTENTDNLIDVDDVVFTSTEFVNVPQMRKIIAKTGIKSYLKGSKLGPLSKKLKTSTGGTKETDIKALANSLYTNLSRPDIISKSKETYQKVFGFKRSIKLYRTVLKRMEDAINL